MHGMIVSVILRSYFEPIPLPILPYISYFIFVPLVIVGCRLDVRGNQLSVLCRNLLICSHLVPKCR